nr:glycoside hydrolase family 88 protein [Vagococcus bubulae]
MLKKIDENATKFITTMPDAASTKLIYPEDHNQEWTSSFWIGELFLAKELSGSKKYDALIETQLNEFKKRLDYDIELDHHDIGFLYILSAVADYKVTGSNQSKKMAIKAANRLMTRFNEASGIIQAWGDLEDKKESGRMIIDCLMNIPLLYFASNVTGEDKYYQAAYRHAKQTQKYILREDSTTYHTYFFDKVSGEAIKGETAQGYSDDSCWSRGQAWGIYGFALSYRYTGDASFIQSACEVADYFISKLPADYVCYWDLVFGEGSNQPRDTSAAAIAACGLLELAKYLPVLSDKKREYESVAVNIIQNLATTYTTEAYPESNGLLIEGVYSYPENRGVNECMIWGDYFYLEALTRAGQVWNSYW